MLTQIRTLSTSSNSPFRSLQVPVSPGGTSYHWGRLWDLDRDGLQSLQFTWASSVSLGAMMQALVGWVHSPRYFLTILLTVASSATRTQGALQPRTRIRTFVWWWENRSRDGFFYQNTSRIIVSNQIRLIYTSKEVTISPIATTTGRF